MVICDVCGEDASDKGSLVFWPNGQRSIYCERCINPIHDTYPINYEDEEGFFDFYWGWEKELAIEAKEHFSNRWFAVMHVMSRLGVWKPYLKWTEQILDLVAGIEKIIHQPTEVK